MFSKTGVSVFASDKQKHKVVMCFYDTAYSYRICLISLNSWKGYLRTSRTIILLPAWQVRMLCCSINEVKDQKMTHKVFLFDNCA